NLFNTRIPHHNCSIEEFTHLLICYKCYKIEDHPTNQCKSTTPICSECSSEGHIWTECTSPTKKCINCPPSNNDHRTLAAMCPHRRAKMEEKKKQDDHRRNEQTKRYLRINNSPHRPTNHPTYPQHHLKQPYSAKTYCTYFRSPYCQPHQQGTLRRPALSVTTNQLRNRRQISRQRLPKDFQLILSTSGTGARHLQTPRRTSIPTKKPPKKQTGPPSNAHKKQIRTAFS
ncbi:hypothetical protein EQH57_0715, partial [Dictyocoela roeselum]